MQITIGEYTTRNGCRAIVDARDGSLFSGVVITGGGFTQVRVWWDSTGAVKFPDGNWCNCTSGGVLFTYNGHPTPMLQYSDSTYIVLTAAPSPFDITGPKQMKEETKPETTQNQRLIKILDGSWLDPKTITAITVLKCDKYDIGDRFVVNSTTGIIRVVTCASFAEAQRMADELAEKVNSIK